MSGSAVVSGTVVVGSGVVVVGSGVVVVVEVVMSGVVVVVSSSGALVTFVIFSININGAVVVTYSVVFGKRAQTLGDIS